MSILSCVSPLLSLQIWITLVEYQRRNDTRRNDTRHNDIWYNSLIATLSSKDTVKDSQRQSKTVKDSQRQSKTVKDSQRQSKTVKDSQRQLQTVTDSHRTSLSIYIPCHFAKCRHAKCRRGDSRGVVSTVTIRPTFQLFLEQYLPSKTLDDCDQGILSRGEGSVPLSTFTN